MKTFKQALVATTALTLSLGVAYADENKAVLNQSGEDNVASIDQSIGSGNLAGRVSANRGLWLEQKGDYNELEIIQQGTNSRIGSNAEGNSGNFLQEGDRNDVYIKQTGDQNIVENVTQYSNTGEVETKNELDITQSNSTTNSGNGIRIITQDARTDDGSVDEPGNELTIKMTGSNNAIDEVYQKSAVSVQGQPLTSTVKNNAAITVTGSSNGLQTTLSGLAGVAAGSRYRQTGRANTMTVTITGDTNGVGVSQTGETNTVGTLTLSGDSNQVGVKQIGNDNTVTLENVSGDSNIIGFNQDGSTNKATGSVRTGNGNTFQISQLGDNGTGTIKINNGSTNGYGTNSILNNGGLRLASGVMTQLGDGDIATLQITNGDSNGFAFSQGRGNGGGNLIDSVIENGDFNALAIAQAGSGNTAYSAQNGNRNQALVKQ